MTDKQRQRCPWRLGPNCIALLAIKNSEQSRCCDENCGPQFVLNYMKENK